MSIYTAKFLAEVIRLTDAAVVGWDNEGVVKLWSPGAQRLLGYTPEEVLGRDTDVFRLDPMSPGDGVVTTALTRGDVETQVRHRDGTVLDLLMRVYPTSECVDGSRPGFAGGTGGLDDATPIARSGARGHGAPVVIWAVLHDISERKRAERVAEATARRLAHAQQTANVGSFEVDLVTGERWWSAEFWRVHGLQPRSGRPSYDIHVAAVDPADKAAFTAHWDELHRGEPSPDIEYRIVRPDGEVRWVRTRASQGTSEVTGNPIVSGTTMDITDMRSAMRERYRARRTFQESFERSPVGQAVVGLDLRVEEINPALCAIAGRTAEELVGTSATDFLFRDGEGYDVGGGLHHLDREWVEHQLVRPDGSAIWVSTRMSSVPDADGKASLYFLWVVDISDRKHREQVLAHQASHDALTGLPNRVPLTERLERSLAQARRSGGQVAVLFIDIDQFKMVNDSLGHDAGDHLLVQLTGRLSSVLGDGDLLARFGGDEFVIVRDGTDADGARELADRITDVTSRPLLLEGQELFVTVSVGITMATGRRPPRTCSAAPTRRCTGPRPAATGTRRCTPRRSTSAPGTG